MNPWVLALLLSSASVLAGDDGWALVVQAEVRAMEGYPVVLPCSFSHPLHSHHASLQVSWRRGHGADSVVVFHCVSRSGAEGCEPELHQDQRYRLEGNPREHDLSLRINGATLQDSGRYYCQVEIQGKEHSDKMGTRVRVEAPPKILSVTLEGSSDSGYSAVCRVQGSPLPDVQWLDPDVWLQGSGAEALAEGSHYHTEGRVQDLRPHTHYTCAATNPLGRDQATLYFLQPPPLCAGGLEPLTLLLSFALGSKLVLLLGAGLWMVRRGTLQCPQCPKLKAIFNLN
ncbi:V-set and Ig domain-containing protein [Boleophthalmus pectinirostris]|uniref:V-set and Ig domain-containing protein n=1 Tax=Boleophthalmus pectinirostris TaxID=150288 RepID=UPI0024306122|nr:V-set and Ig domain-containing protein [Boleophthalmus pectinirostris]